MLKSVIRGCFFIVIFVSCNLFSMENKHVKACVECQKIHHKCDKEYPRCGYCKQTSKQCTRDNNIKKRGRPVGSSKKNKKYKQKCSDENIISMSPDEEKIAEIEHPEKLYEESSSLAMTSTTQNACSCCKTATMRKAFSIIDFEWITLCERCDVLYFELE